MAVDESTARSATITVRDIDEVVVDARTRLLREEERAVIDQYGGSRGVGRRAALVLVDFQGAYLGRDVPIAEQLDEHPAGAGEAGWRALRRAAAVLEAARVAGAPVVYTVVGRAASADLGFDGKRRRRADLTVGGSGTAVAELIAPRPGEELVTKPAASIFHATAVEDHLRSREVDTLIIAGLSTGGCVRASVVDAAARGFRPIVVADAVADRLRISHEAALIDIWMKYGDLVLADDAVEFFDRLRDEQHGQERRG